MELRSTRRHERGRGCNKNLNFALNKQQRGARRRPPQVRAGAGAGAGAAAELLIYEYSIYARTYSFGRKQRPAALCAVNNIWNERVCKQRACPRSPPQRCIVRRVLRCL